MERGRIQERPKFWEYPLLSQEWVKLLTSSLAGIFTWERKSIKNLGEKGAWAHRGTAHFVSGTGKATNFKFGRDIRSVHANKSPIKIWEKRERGRIQGLTKFFQYPLLSQERVMLRTSNFVRTFFSSIDWNKSPLQISGKVAWA